MTLDRRRFVALSAASAAGLAGCMGDGGDGNATDDGNDSDDRPPGATTAQQAYPDYDWAQLEGESAVGTDRISMQDLEFVPLVATVPVDTRINVQNDDATAHTFTVPRAGIDERLGGGAETSVRFDETGTYDYVCTIHSPSMVGRVIVEEDVDVSGAMANESATNDSS